MCPFISWIEHKDNVYFLDDSKLNTKQGKELLRPEYISDLLGHGAIRHFYSELGYKGIDKECENFTTPNNFPHEIVSAIKKGKFINFGICLNILTQPARAEYEKINQPARAEYEKIKQPAWAEYEKITQSAWAEYGKITQSAWAEYEKIKQPAWAEYEKIKQSAFWRIARKKENRINVWK